MSVKDKDGVFYHPETGEVLNGLRQSLLSLDGRLEYPDPVPMEPAVSVRPASGMRQMVQELIRQEMSQLADAYEMESFEEADDFDLEDEAMPPLTDAERSALEGDERAFKRRTPAAAPQAPAGEPGASGAAPPIPATSSSSATAAAPAEPIVKRSESTTVPVAPEAVQPVDRT